ncbi:MAG: winged-helix domain-containing protein [Ardenticatenia bacterium]|nr:winged-helix domain-containing protein [Ardenticatenia bacterium]
MEKHIPDIVIHRLPIYLRALELMARAGHDITSSQELGGAFRYQFSSNS